MLYIYFNYKFEELYICYYISMLCPLLHLKYLPFTTFHTVTFSFSIAHVHVTLISVLFSQRVKPSTTNPCILTTSFLNAHK